MLKAIALLVLGVGVAQPAFAGPIVTWEAFGVVTSAFSRFPPVPTGSFPDGIPQSPPVGTPWSLQLTFDPEMRVATPGAPAGAPCYMNTSLEGSYQLGGASYTLSGSSDAMFSNSALPGTNCAGAGSLAPVQNEFFMFPRPVDGDPWRLSDLGPFFLLASYTDLFHQDGTFAGIPAYALPGTLRYNNDFFNFSSPFAPTAVNDPNASPVPEPGTLALMGIGLAYGAQRRWRARR